jgi:hypothetical protein
MKSLLLAVVLVFSATARAAEPCQKEMKGYEDALDRAAKAQQALNAYDNSPLAPVVPGQADKERQQLLDNLEAARADVRMASDAHDNCVKRKQCKKWKPGWACTIAWTYEKCCLDKPERSTGTGKGP